MASSFANVVKHPGRRSKTPYLPSIENLAAHALQPNVKLDSDQLCGVSIHNGTDVSLVIP